jgi:hypothetical protein
MSCDTSQQIAADQDMRDDDEKKHGSGRLFGRELPA